MQLRIGDALIAPGLALALAVTAACGGGDAGLGPDGGDSSPAEAKPSPTEGEPGAGERLEGKIAFVSFRDGKQEIYVINADGTDERNLTKHPADDFDPDWSPDGTEIAFVSKRTGRSEVYAMDADGSNQRQLTEGGGLSPRWSRDGSRIVYTRGGALAVMNADGSNDQVILETGPEDSAEPCRAGSFPGGWSPDDRLITYYAASVSRQEGQVCTITPDGLEIEVIVAEPGVYDVEPVFSPDGRSIVYRAIIEGQHDIWVVDLENGAQTNLTDDSDLDIEPDWSPDGEWIAFGSLRSGEPNFDLYVMRQDGSDVRRLTDDPAKEANPVWAP